MGVDMTACLATVFFETADRYHAVVADFGFASVIFRIRRLRRHYHIAVIIIIILSSFRC